MLQVQIPQANGCNTTGKFRVLIPTGLPRNLDLVAVGVESSALLGHSHINMFHGEGWGPQENGDGESVSDSLDVSRASMTPNAHLDYGNIGTGANTRVRLRTHTCKYTYL
jgi:hypothetical protein